MEKGAVLHCTNFFAYGRLAPGAWTTPSKLEGQQEIYYILGGEGEITAGGDTAKLHKNIAVLMPAGLEFVMKSTGDDPLTMYVINEPLPDDNGIVGNPGRIPFHPKTKMVVKDEASAPENPRRRRSLYCRWRLRPLGAYCQGAIFSGRRTGNGAECDHGEINPKTMGEPHPHRPGQEEVWAAIDGSSLILMGTELRVQRPGMAYMLPPDAITVHSNINAGDTPVKFLYFARFPQGDNWTHAVPAKK